jgi:hypothetical protein
MVIAALLLISIPQVDDTAKVVNDSPAVAIDTATKDLTQFRSSSGQWLTFESCAKRIKFKHLHGRESFLEKAIRVPAANRPRLIRETILATFADQPGIEIVGQVTND